MNDGAMLRTADIGTVHDQFFTLRDFSLANGSVLPEATIVYETYGRLAPDSRNAVLITHGYTGSHHAAGRNPANGNQPGSWDGLIGPGKAIDPEWHGGRYYGKGGAKTVLTEIRVETLKRYGIEANLTPRYPDSAEREAAIRQLAANWARNWDAHSLIILRRALLGFDTRPDFAKIRAKVLYILCRSDALFPPKIAPAVIEALEKAGVEARYFELDSDMGHSSSGPEHAKWSPVLREFLAPLVARLN